MNSGSQKIRGFFSRLVYYERSAGFTIRKGISKVSSTLRPYIVRVIPNFRAAHYTYILFMTFLMAVIVYPISSFRFIDILFLTSGAATQAGLNTINLNELRLSQQILVYVSTTLTTPIFIHGSLLFIRLYRFEQYFDNIKESSKLNFKMRRNNTLAARTQSMDRTAKNTANNTGIGRRPEPNTGDSVDPLARPDSMSNSSSTNSKQTGSDHQTMYQEPSDEEEGPKPTALPTETDGIKFADLPKPTKRTAEIDPSDMYKSINMLQNKRRDSGIDDDVLIIKPPNEIEHSSDTPIFTTKSHLPFSSPRWQRSRAKRKSRKRQRTWDALRKTISNSSVSKRRGRTSSFEVDDVQENDNESIDSEMHNNTISNAAGSISSNPDHDETEDDEDGDDDDGVDSEFDDDDSHAVLDSGNELDEIEPKEDPNGTTGAAHDTKTKFAEPKTRPPKRSSTNQRRRLRKWRTPNLSRLTSRTGSRYGSRRGQTESDDEEDSIDSNELGLSQTSSANYLSWTPTIGRNSTFVHLTEEQKEELGGVEYRAVKLLTKIICAYYAGFHIMAFCFFVAFIKVDSKHQGLIRDIGVSPVWWGFFTAQSVFNDLGLTLTPNSMMNYSRSVYILVVASFFIVIGNTGFPVLLRFIIWVMYKTSKPLSLYRESLQFLLDHPRRCFTLLFPSVPTWWLFFILIVLNATDLVLFIILDLKRSFLNSIPVPYRVLDGLFQAFSTRTAGFSVLDLSQLHAAVQVSYMIMMYISVLPLAISIRRTNVYEEQSLGVYLKGGEGNEGDDSHKSFVGTHLRNQLSFDLWFIFLGLFIICIAEGGRLDSHNERFTVFAILFEIISAYGTVGLSLGYPGIDQSLSAKFTTVSKLVIIAMMIRGRHRGLPYSLDRAIMLPDDKMQMRDRVQEHHAIIRGSTLDAVPSRQFSDHSASGFSGGLSGLRRTITKTANAYRRNSLFPAPTKLNDDLYEMRNVETQRGSTSAGH